MRRWLIVITLTLLVLSSLSYGGDGEISLDLYSQCHIDLMWQWGWRETIEITKRTFERHLELIRKLPGYAYYQNQAALYAAIEEKYPDLFHKIQEEVKRGRWHVVGGNWAETDMGLCVGESSVRNLLYGKRYFRSRFGVDVKTFWQMEGSAYLDTLPQFYADVVSGEV